MYHIVYLTTNITNSKIYVGVHSTNNLDDGYLGSGKTLLKAIKKYGKQNFKRQILHYCLDETHAYELEAQIVDKTFVKCNNTYNIVLGGNKPPNIWDIYDDTKLIKYRKIISERLGKYGKITGFKKGVNYYEKLPKDSKIIRNYKISKYRIDIIKNDINEKERLIKNLNSEESIKKRSKSLTGKKFSNERKLNISNSKKGIGIGIENSNAKEWILISPTGNIYDVSGDLINSCKKLKLSIYQLQKYINNQVPKVSNTNTIGWTLMNNKSFLK